MENTIAHKILQQLGGYKFIAMTGAKKFVSDANSVRFQLPKVLFDKIIKITLNANDLYDIEFAKIEKLQYKIFNIVTNISCDKLMSTIEQQTKLRFHL